MSAFVLLLAIVSVSISAAAQIAFRKTMLMVGPLPSSSDDFLHFVFEIIFNHWFMLGISCYGVSIIIWLLVLSKMEVSAAYPLVSIGFVITALIGGLFLGENVNSFRIGGILLICSGIALIARGA